MLKNNAPFKSCVSKINSTLIDNAEDLDIVILMYNLLEYSQNYSMTSESFWNYFLKLLIPYLNKLVDQYNNTYHHSINKKPINADNSASTENVDSNPKAPQFKVNDSVRIRKHKNIFSKGYIEN